MTRQGILKPSARYGDPMRSLPAALFAALVVAPVAAADGPAGALAPGDPWGDGLGGPLAGLGEEAGSLVVELATKGPTSWVLHRVAVPSGETPVLPAPGPPPAATAEFPLLVLPELREPALDADAPAEPSRVAPAPTLGPDAAAGRVASTAATLDAAVRAALVVDAGAALLALHLPDATRIIDAPEATVPAGPLGVAGSAPRGGDAPLLETEAALGRDEALAPAAPVKPAGGPAAPPATLAERAATAAAEAAAGDRLLVLAAAGLLLLLPFLYHRLHHEQALDHPRRRAIYAAILARPGSTIQTVADAAAVNRGTALHHLRILGRQGLVQARRGTKEVHLFPAGARLGPEETARHAVLARTGARELADAVAAAPGRTRVEAARALAVAPSTLDWHLRGLLATGLVLERAGPGGRRELVPGPALLRILAEQAGAAPPPAPAKAAPA